MSPRTERPIAFEPNEGPQTEFLASTEFEVLYGGAAGGGKSIALVIDALGMGQVRPNGEVANAIDHPQYRALILRKNYTDLREIIDYGRHYYPLIVPGAEWKKGDRLFLFPSGARIELGHVQNPGDEERYKSRAFQYIGWEELTEHATPYAYEYLFSRCRGPEELPKAIRATTNPDGPGNAWVKERFGIPDSGVDVPRFAVKVKVNGRTRILTRRFIRALVSDNPQIDSEYEIRLAGMSAMKRRALRDGRWDIIDLQGAIYADEMELLYAQKRITTVAVTRGIPVNTFWDLGATDSMAIWFHQRVALQNRFVRYYQNSHKSIDHYARYLKDQGYLYGTHYLPHDAAHRPLGEHSNKSLQEMFEDAGITPTVIVPRADNLAQAIELTRAAFDQAWFDEERCKDGLTALKTYRWAYSQKEGVPINRPLHNAASHGADAFRQFAQGYDEYTAAAESAPPKAPERVQRAPYIAEELQHMEDWTV